MYQGAEEVVEHHLTNLLLFSRTNLADGNLDLVAGHLVGDVPYDH